MPIDASIYGNIQQPANLLDQYSKLAQLKALQTTSRLHELQGQAAEQGLTEAEAVRQAGIESGGDTSRLPALLFGRGAVKPGMEAQAAVIKARQEQAGTEHTQAQTRDITAKHIAGAWSALAKYNGSDEGVRATHDLMAPVVGEQAAQQVTEKLLAMPPEKRLAYSVAQAATNPVGQEALKLYFPETSTATVGMGPGGAQVTTTAKGRPGLNAPMKPAAASTAETSGLAGEDFLKSIPKNVADQVKALAEGRMPFPGGFALKTPYWQNMITMVSQYDPNFDMVNYQARNATRKDFFGGGKSAVNLTAINTAIGHLNSFDKAAEALGNSDYPMFNKVFQTVAPSAGGGEMAGKIRTFQQAKEAVANELMRVFRGVGASSSDTAKWAETLNASDSPAALKAAVRGATDLLDSRIEALNEQYRRGMGSTANTEDTLSMVYPKARATLERLRSGKPASTRGSVNAAPAAAPDVQKLLDKYAPMQGTRG